MDTANALSYSRRKAVSGYNTTPTAANTPSNQPQHTPARPHPNLPAQLAAGLIGHICDVGIPEELVTQPLQHITRVPFLSCSTPTPTAP